MGIHWAKESLGALVDAHVSVLWFSASLRTHGDPTCHAKKQNSLACRTSGS